MKKIIIPLLVIGWLAAGCGDKGHDVSQQPTFEVTSADVEYDASGGEGTIKLEFNGGGTVEATAEKSWCRVTVSGSTVNVSVDPHDSFQSRESEITIRKDNYTRRIGIFQSGTLFYPLDEYGELGYMPGDVLNVPFIADGMFNVTVEDHPDWADAQWDGEKLVVTATEAGLQTGARTGTIALLVNGISKTVSVTQGQFLLSYETFLGDYVLTAYGPGSAFNEGNFYSYDVSIVADEPGDTYILEGLDYPIAMSYSNGEFSFKNAQKVGSYTAGVNTYDVAIRFVSDASGWSSTSSYYMYSTYEIVNGKMVITLLPYETSSTVYTGWGFFYTDAAGTLYSPNKFRHEIKMYPR